MRARVSLRPTPHQHLPDLVRQDGHRVGAPRPLSGWPLSPAAEGPAIVIGKVHHPVKPEESRAPEWLMIPPPKRVPPQVVTSLREPVPPTGYCAPPRPGYRAAGAVGGINAGSAPDGVGFRSGIRGRYGAVTVADVLRTSTGVPSRWENSPDSLRSPGASTAAPSSASLRPFG